MHRLAVVALTLLVIIASILPPVLARETNADRLKRGYPPLPPGRREPTRRDTAKRSGSSPTPPKTVSGIIEVRDKAGSHRLGWVLNDADAYPDVGVTDQDQEDELEVTFCSQSSTLKATNLHFTNPPFPAPYYLGSTFPDPNNPGQTPPEGCPLTIVPDSPGAQIWSYDWKTKELTIAFDVGGTTIPAGFVWDKSLNELEIVTSWPAPDGVTTVRLYLVDDQ